MAAGVNPPGRADDALICCGNPLLDADSVGRRVLERLRLASDLPPGVEIIDGGLAGIDLLPLLEGRRRVVLVDTVEEGMAAPSKLGRDELAALADRFGHGAGLPFLAALLPRVMERPPELTLIGAPASCGEAGIEAAARACRELFHG